MTIATPAPDPVAASTREVKTYCAECGARCGVIARVEEGRLVSVRPDRSHPNLGFCIKGEAAPEKVYNAGRIRYPLKRTNPKTADDPGWVRISWDEALDEVVRNLMRIREESGPEAVAFTRPALMGSGSVDWAHWLIRLSRAFGSPNFISTTHICQWARDQGSAYTYGTGLPKPDYENARTIVIWGNNPSVTEVHNWRRIKAAKRRGVQLIVIDPRKTGTAAAADHWLSIVPGTDAALALGMIRLFLAERLYQEGFVQAWTNAPFLVDRARGRFLRPADLGLSGDAGHFVVQSAAGELETVDPSRDGSAGPAAELFADGRWPRPDGGEIAAATAFQLLREAVEPYTLDAVAATTGLPAAQIAEVARLIGRDLPVSYYTHNGVEQHINTMQTNRVLCILFAMTGCYDAPGGNALFPAVPTNPVDGIEFLNAERIGRRLGVRERSMGAPRYSAQAYKFYDAVLDGAPYRLRALVGFGGNMLMQNGDSCRGRAAFQALDFQVHVDMFETPSSRLADILLPAATCWESPGVAPGFGGRPETGTYIQYREPIVEPQGEARPDVQILFDLAVRLGLGEHFWNGDYRAAYQHQIAPSGLTLDDLQAQPAGIQIDRPVRYRGYATTTPDGEVTGFKTPSRRIEIYSELFFDHGLNPLPDFQGAAWQRQRQAPGGDQFPLILTTAKVTAYLHSGGRGLPTLRKKVPEPFVELHPQTAIECGVADRQMAEIATPHGRLRARARCTDRIIPGVVAIQTGWWEACEELGLPGHDPFGPEGSNVNYAVTNDLLDPISGSVPGKSYSCRLTPLAAEFDATEVSR